MSIRTITAALPAALLLASACGGDRDQARADAIRDAMCACKDRACADAVDPANRRSFGELTLGKYRRLDDAPARLRKTIEEINRCSIAIRGVQ